MRDSSVRPLFRTTIQIAVTNSISHCIVVGDREDGSNPEHVDWRLERTFFYRLSLSPKDAKDEVKILKNMPSCTPDIFLHGHYFG